MMKVDFFLQVFISDVAIVDVGFISYNFTEKAVPTVHYLVSAPPLTDGSTDTDDDTDGGTGIIADEITFN